MNEGVCDTFMDNEDQEIIINRLYASENKLLTKVHFISQTKNTNKHVYVPYLKKYLYVTM